MTTTTRGAQVMVRLLHKQGTDQVAVDHHGYVDEPVIRERRSSALAELRRLAGPNSGARARELMAEVRRYDAWLGEER